MTQQRTFKGSLRGRLDQLRAMTPVVTTRGHLGALEAAVATNEATLHHHEAKFAALFNAMDEACEAAGLRISAVSYGDPVVDRVQARRRRIESTGLTLIRGDG